MVGSTESGAPLITGPVILGVRGPSRSGKTALCELLVRALGERGLLVAWAKRTHHAVDLPGKSSDRIWAESPAVTLLRSDDRLAITTHPGSRNAVELAAASPVAVDVVLLETHEPEPFPTILSDQLEPAPGEQVVGRWTFREEREAIEPAIVFLASVLPADRELDFAMRRAIALHGGRGCAGLVLGTRLALAGARALEIDVPDTQKRLITVAETERCAVDGLQAVTGCRVGKRTLRVLDYGKLAATFFDERTGAAIRVATRGDLRDRVGVHGPERYAAQRLAYATWPEADLFTLQAVDFIPAQFDRPGPPQARVLCAACGEEVSDGRHIDSASGPLCQPCWQVSKDHQKE